MCQHVAHALGLNCPSCSIDVIALLTRRLKPEIVELSLKRSQNTLAGVDPEVREAGSFISEPSINEKPALESFAKGERPGGCIDGSIEQTVTVVEYADVVADQCRRSLSRFVREHWPVMMPGIPLHWNWHLSEICKHVQGLLEEWIKKQLDPSYEMLAQKMVINCPPRSLKSTIVSVCALGWMWLRWPSFKALFLSANPHVAVRDARGCKALLSSDWYADLKDRLGLTWQLDSKHDADGDFANTAGGIRLAMGFTAIVTGLGADGIFVDDPNDAKKVFSDAERSRINDTWDMSLANRVNDYSSSISLEIQQRLHEDDHTGHVLAGGDWVHLPIPLEYDPDWIIKTPFGYHDPRTVAGEILHEARFPSKVVASEKKRLGNAAEGQLNQRPAPAEGGAFKRAFWNFCRLDIKQEDLNPLAGCRPLLGTARRPKGCHDRPAVPIPFLDSLTISVDATFGSLSDSASAVAIVVIGAKGADRFVLHDDTKARDYPDTKRAITDAVRLFPSASRVLIEKKANGAALISELRSTVSGVIGLEANDSWIVRANVLLPAVEAGNWYLLDGAPWLDSFVHEFSVFPNGSKDDRIDACSQYATYFGASAYQLPDW